MKTIYKKTVYLLATIILPVSVTSVILDQYGLKNLPFAESWDAIVVAGARVDPNGQPSLSLKRRTQMAVNLHEKGLAPVVVFTGGLGEHPPTEALAASKWAISIGLPEKAILLEDTSTSTQENAKNVADKYQLKSVLVVTDSYHVFRCEKVFSKYFVKASVIGVKPPLWPRIRGSIREIAAISVYKIKGRI